jgi:hypothetical protein
MRKLLLPCLTAATLATLSAVPASASPVSPASGTFSPVTMAITSTRTDGGNTFVTANRTAVLTGSFAGPTTDTVTIVFHADGTTSVHGQGTCACTVDGISGALSYQFVGSGTFPSSASGQYMLQGLGALAGLQAEGPFSGTFQTVTYSGQLHFS